MPRSKSYDAVVVGAGHNGLAAAAYLARAGRRCLVLERSDAVGGAAVSERPFAGVDARLSRYAYLVSLLPLRIVDELGLRVTLARRAVASYTPDPRAGGAHGLLVDEADAPATAASFRRVTGGDAELRAWQGFHAGIARVARRIFPTLLEPLRSEADLRAIARDDVVWDALVRVPLGDAVDAAFADDLVRGVVLTDALIGTFAAAGDRDLRQNRCFLYHVIGGGTGDWLVPVGGMGEVTRALREAALAAGAELCAGIEVTAVGDSEVRFAGTGGGAEEAVAARRVLAAVAPAELDRLRGRAPATPAPEGAQLKVNLLLSRLPRLRDPAVDPARAFAGTLHVNQTASQLQTAHDDAAAGRIPSLPPCEAYCHTLTDRSILGPELAAVGVQTMTLFGLHMPARLFAGDDRRARDDALAATLRSLSSVLAEPLEDCLLRTPDGEPCVEAHSPLDLERELRMPGGHIFHRDLSWPFAEEPHDVGRWGVETDDPAIMLCGAGARRGGGVSAIPGRNAAIAVLAGERGPPRRGRGSPRTCAREKMRYNGGHDTGSTATMHYWGPLKTSPDTIRRFGELAERAGKDATAAARSWSAAGFDDEQTTRWLEARCFDPQAARELADLSVTPRQASARTRDGRGDYRDTIGFKVANGDLSPRQGAARASSSR